MSRKKKSEVAKQADEYVKAQIERLGPPPPICPVFFKVTTKGNRRRTVLVHNPITEQCP